MSGSATAPNTPVPRARSFTSAACCSAPLNQALLAIKPLSMLIQCLDASHVRLGFRGKESDSWTFSEICDVKEALGAEIGAFGMHCWSTTTGRKYGAKPGAPMYQKFLIDYVRYRYGVSGD